MADDKAPNPPLPELGFVDPKAGGRMTPLGYQMMNQLWRQIAAGFPVVPCVATGTDAITINPRLHREGARTLADHMTFSFEAVATSTGAVTIQLGSLTALKAYIDNGATQANAGDLVDGSLYLVSYLSTLDSGAGGFVIINAAPTIEENISVAKGWAKFNDTTILASHNVSSVTSSGAGIENVNWDIDFSSADYAVVASAFKASPASAAANVAASISAQAAGSVQVRRAYLGDNALSSAYSDGIIYVVAFGAQ